MGEAAIRATWMPEKMDLGKRRDGARSLMGRGDLEMDDRPGLWVSGGQGKIVRQCYRRVSLVQLYAFWPSPPPTPLRRLCL